MFLLNCFDIYAGHLPHMIIGDFPGCYNWPCHRDGEHHWDSRGGIIGDELTEFKLEEGYSWPCDVGFAIRVKELVQRFLAMVELP